MKIEYEGFLHFIWGDERVQDTLKGKKYVLQKLLTHYTHGFEDAVIVYTEERLVLLKIHLKTS